MGTPATAVYDYVKVFFNVNGDDMRTSTRQTTVSSTISLNVEGACIEIFIQKWIYERAAVLMLMLLMLSLAYRYAYAYILVKTSHYFSQSFLPNVNGGDMRTSTRRQPFRPPSRLTSRGLVSRFSSRNGFTRGRLSLCLCC